MTKIKHAKPTKALEIAARSVKDSDEFVAHVASIASRYRRARALSSGSEARAMRQALRAFQKQAESLSLWLQRAQQVSRATPEANAYRRVNAALYRASGAGADDAAMRAWLSQTAAVAAVELRSHKRDHLGPASEAVRLAVEGLRATFEHHKLKWSAVVTKTRQSDAVRLVCAIAKQAGDAVAPHTAKLWLTAKL